MQTQTDHQLTKTHVELKSTQRIETQRGKTAKLKIAYFNRWRDGEARWASGADRSKGYHDLLLLQLVDFLSHDSKTRDSATLRQIPARTTRVFVSPVRGMRFDVSPVQINPKGNAMDQFWGRGVHHEKIGLKFMPFLVWDSELLILDGPEHLQSTNLENGGGLGEESWAWQGETFLLTTRKAQLWIVHWQWYYLAKVQLFPSQLMLTGQRPAAVLEMSTQW